MNLQVKICGLKEETHLRTAIDHGADFVGFNFFARSPRALSPEEAAPLSHYAGQKIIKVGLLVDAEDAYIAELLRVCPLDMLQLHGGESPERVAEIKRLFQLPVMKALPLADQQDLLAVPLYSDVADWLLFDAKPRAGDERPGGNARSFDWSLLSGFKTPKPWMLAGGLKVENIAQAIQVSGATIIDVSSGVENAPGQKDAAKIATLLAKARELSQAS